ncbi:ABC transporter substrate-binding protein [Pseudomonas fluorescens]|jgi:hypothetical protein|uniref:DUF2076 domain-containing protein n=2 Tax=Pseudomonas TaxID=286 RepID=A0A1B3CYR0_PSEFL|nr:MULTISPECIES: DUF2076 domain-containing protein [Pseudomonas]AHC38012.1 ABC transporter substrate-binding protein [Pseudomonas sp. TKP]AOE70184.1 ABC transporter substrate-binding protein [Pseudomonas fluorescens]AOE75961.1 ABC transporter substrate-binding protein [Pseudomonas fluorescens]MBL1310586.1 DUF2076 domain-containing protein [Pseudomonas sp.]PMX12170.1 DUF2076 domain-containing protein [Pseudomonas sp. MPBC4-3]
MNSEEQTLIDGLFSRLQQAETDSAPRDAQAEARIKEHMTRQPAAGYYMTQSILVQEHALKSLDEQNKQQAQQIQQLQDELQRAKSQAAQPAPSSGGFLSSIFGGGSRDAQPAPSAPASSGGGWREPARPSFGQPAPQQNYGAPQQNYQQPQQPAAPIGSGFLGGALKTAAGVAGGVMLAEGISSLFNHNSQQPQVVEEIIREEPAPASDNSNWGNDDQKFAGNDSWGGGNSDSFADNDYSDDDSSFGDDDSFV